MPNMKHAPNHPLHHSSPDTWVPRCRVCVLAPHRVAKICLLISCYGYRLIACTFIFGEISPSLYDFSRDFLKSTSSSSSSPHGESQRQTRRRRVWKQQLSAAMAGGAGARDPLVASEIHGFLTCAGRPTPPPSSSAGFVFTARLLVACCYFLSVLFGAGGSVIPAG